MCTLFPSPGSPCEPGHWVQSAQRRKGTAGEGWDMFFRRGAPRRRTALVGAALALAGCHLGARPVTYELVHDSDWPLGPLAVESGDLDGDGDLDLLVTGTNGYATLANDGSGGYAVDYSSRHEPSTLHPALVDVDGDGDLDVVGAVPTTESSQPTAPAVRRNDGTGALGPVEFVQPDALPGRLTSVTHSDVDRDGDADLLASFVVGRERRVGVYLNDSSGAFGTPETFSFRFTSHLGTDAIVVAGDVDGDGDEDAVATDVGEVALPDGEVAWRPFALLALNDGAGAFTEAHDPVDLAVSGLGGVVDAPTPALADLDGDGYLDLAVGGEGTVTTLLADGSGGWQSPRRTAIAARTDFIAIADVDLDGVPDIIGFKSDDDALMGVVAYGDGAGGVSDVHEVATGTGLGADGTPAREVEVTDIEGDGDPDVVFLAGSLGLLENALDGGRPNH